jgi:excinuclease ABC subunit A
MPDTGREAAPNAPGVRATGAAQQDRDAIVIRGARQNNLKNLSLELPANELIVVTGVSGSGKSSLVFDTL